MVQARKAKRKVLIAAFVAHSAQMSGIARYARENDWHLVTDMMFTGTFPRGWKGDGILAISGYRPDLAVHLRNSGLPCVVIASTDEPALLPRIEEDHAQIGRVAADHLLERAYRSFAWAPLLNDNANRDRLRGFQSRLAENNCKCHILPEAHTRIGPYWQCNWMDYQHRLAAEIQRLPRPTAIFCFNDCVAANVIDACDENGASVPEEFAILGVGNDPLVCESVPVPLSSVEPDHEQMAYRAAEALDNFMNRQAMPQEVVYVPPKGVITRVSTDVCAVADPRIARALSFIAENYPDPMLSVLDVAVAVGVSRRQLERNFRELTGYTVKEHIVRTRMREASRLLTNYPRTKCSDIGALVGLARDGSFFRTFRQFYGMCPQAHRALAARKADAKPPSDSTLRAIA